MARKIRDPRPRLDLETEALSALEQARALPPGPERTEAMKRAGTTRVQVKTGLEQLRGFRGAMADYTFDTKHNGVRRFYLVRIRGGNPLLEAVLDRRP